jgi:mannose-6-phosphate isomerase-like protein (cupin superfamily)
MEPGVTFASLDLEHDERFQRLRAQLGVSAFGLNFLLLRPGQRGRIHRHLRQEEVYVVLQGTLTLVIEGNEHELGRGELARVAPDVRRQLVNRRPETLAVLAIGGATGHEGRDGRAYESWDETGEGRTPQEVSLPADVAVTAPPADPSS